MNFMLFILTHFGGGALKNACHYLNFQILHFLNIVSSKKF